jgi:hypothetical protein
VDEALVAISSSLSGSSPVSNAFDVGVADLWFPNEHPANGAWFTQHAISIYREKLETTPRIGYVSAHEDKIPSTLLSATPFAFRYTKTALREDMLPALVQDMTRSALQFQADIAAIAYNRANPVPIPSNLRNAKCTAIYFGYVTEIAEDEVRANLWDPFQRKPETLRRFPLTLMRKNGVSRIGQSFRTCTFETDDRSCALAFSIEPLSSAARARPLTLRPDFDYSKFRRRE